MLHLIKQFVAIHIEVVRLTINLFVHATTNSQSIDRDRQKIAFVFCFSGRAYMQFLNRLVICQIVKIMQPLIMQLKLRVLYTTKVMSKLSFIFMSSIT